MSRNQSLRRKFVLILAFGLSGCAQKDTPAEAETKASLPPFKLSASIQDLMESEIEPAAEALWQSVSTTITAEGVEEKRPQTDEEWREMRRHAITLVEATNLLMMDGREILAPGRTIADEGVQGVLSAAEVQAKIDTNRQLFIQLATLLHDTGEQMLRAVEAKDTQGMLDAGAAIDEACESCHRVFWYPNQVIPEFPD